ncbi:MAG: hypothetical protein WKF66_17295 [Pedobacter sp.]
MYSQINNGERKYFGMTVNERLYVSGLSNKYHEAVNNKDIRAAITILKEVELGLENIKAILKFDGLISDDFE